MLNETYHSHMKAVYRFPQSLGIIGGKPRAAMYFVSIQGNCRYAMFTLTLADNYLYYLDPHVVQPHALLPPSPDSKYCEVYKSNNVHTTNTIQSFHCSTPQRMPLSAVDPSLSLGFYCADRKDFEDFWRRAQLVRSLFRYLG